MIAGNGVARMLPERRGGFTLPVTLQPADADPFVSGPPAMCSSASKHDQHARAPQYGLV